MIELRRLVAAAVAVAVLPLGAATAAPVTAAPAAVAPVSVPELPMPTGVFAVGRDTWHVVDDSRRDPWVPSEPRELMVGLFYPALSGDGAVAPYATPAEARLLVTRVGARSSDAGEAVRATETHSLTGATPQPGSFPLVVLSPGFGMPRYTLTSLAEELASRGYVVAAVDHANEAMGVEFPDGRMSTCRACETLEDQGAFALLVETRARDVSVLLDRLAAADAPSVARSVDFTRIGMAGHSIGGASAAAAMARDGRVRAGVNMDGAFLSLPPGDDPAGRAFLLLGTDDEVHRPGGSDPTWTLTWPALGMWKRWVTFAGADHYSFTDIPVLAEQLDGSELGLPPGGTLSGQRAVALTRAYVGAFFDQRLRGIPQPLLDGPTPGRPEARFHML
ncbi:alpha/beta hydrolase family protein [Nocardia farcinica]|uniref:Putative hydrolase n=1 Tax=Nocardia farcinica (strain IFM 10152) TaxID=247156 RepID=Q5YRP3_NOCFA|nr:hydrolase [Nocardia farcinica]BAD59148.1 putative hydrolase [Nocardia farcinica IFM 10152]